MDRLTDKKIYKWRDQQILKRLEDGLGKLVVGQAGSWADRKLGKLAVGLSAKTFLDKIEIIFVKTRYLNFLNFSTDLSNPSAPA